MGRITIYLSQRSTANQLNEVNYGSKTMSWWYQIVIYLIFKLCKWGKQSIAKKRCNKKAKKVLLIHWINWNSHRKGAWKMVSAWSRGTPSTNIANWITEGWIDSTINNNNLTTLLVKLEIVKVEQRKVSIDD